MSRSDHWIGLNTRARALVEGARERAYAEHEGAFYNRFPLFAYDMPDGRTLLEVLQTDVWASGPSFFTALEDAASGERLAEWSDQEMADEMGFSVGDAEPSISVADARFFQDVSDSVESGQTSLCWSLEAKYERWRTARSDSNAPARLPVGR